MQHMHVGEEELEMYALERLLPERVYTVESHLLACGTCSGKLPEIVGFAMKLQSTTRKPPAANGEQPREHRIATNEPARMRLLSPFSPNRFEIRILNVSRNGLRVSTPFRLSLATVLQVCCERSIILGEVRWCALSDAEHHAGIQIWDLATIR